MDAHRPPQIVVAVSHSWLRNTFSQLLQRLPVDILPVENVDDLLIRARAKPDAIVLDPFAFGRSSLDLVTRIRREAHYVPVIVLLSSDTGDYRDAAMRLGANAAIAVERAATDLLPTLKTLLGRANLVNGIADRIARTARSNAPAGEAAYGSDPATLNLRERSERTVEQRAMVPETLAAIEPPAGDVATSLKDDGRVFLRGLSLSAGSPHSSSPGRQYRTACNLNCGAHYCGLAVTVHDGRITRIEPADFPDERYRRICLKGISHVQMVAHRDRLLYPLKRAGPRGTSEWERVSWDQALDEIADRVRALREKFGPESLMFFPFSGQLSALNGLTGVYLRLAAALGASGTSLREFGLDSAVPSGIEDTLGEGAGYLANDYADLPNSRLVLIWGGDPAQSRMNWWPFFVEAQRAGTHLIAIDPKYSVTAGKCDEWLPIRPGTDLYLALAMLREIIARDWIDREFVIRHTVAPLLVREDDGRFLNGYVVWDEATQRAVPAERAKSPALAGRFVVKGVACRPAFDLLKERVSAYTPDFAAQKTGLPAERIIALAQAYATVKPARIFTLYGVDRWHHGATFGRLIATLAALTGNLGVPGGDAGVDGFCEGALFDSAFCAPGGKLHRPVNPLRMPEQIVTGLPYPIKAMWVAFGNWLNQWPDQNRLRQEVLPKLDLLVTVDHFMTETARWSDYVLPAAMLFEREDMVKGPGPFVQYQPVIVPPPGECRSDFDIAAALAGLLGVREYFSRQPVEYLAEILAQGDASMRRLSFEELKSKGVLQRDLPPDALVVHRDRKFKTPTGRVEFYVERLLPYGQALPNYQPPIEADPDGDLIHRYPLICLTEHSRYRVHSTFVNTPWLRELDREPCAILHPSVAQPRRIANGDRVRLFNDRGFVVLRARLSQSVPPGTVYLSQGWQSTDFQSGHAQALTHAVGNPANAFGPNCSFSDVLVEVVREVGRQDV
ncbi:MAG TPA: molybdopterin-dependent oxidoreductase [Anaerolineae bacterium]|nr:molybdopterin-dependent oxidoreductase [Anaerolineae bacterium]